MTRWAVAASCALLALCLGPAATSAPVRVEPDPGLQRIAGGLERLARQDRFSGTVLVARAGRTVFARAYGFANTGTRRRNRLDTRFNLASAGKMFTGVAVAQLVERGKLRFTDRVGRYVPELRRAVGSTVTVAQLLDHTSGLGDYFRDPGYQALKPQLTSLERYLPLIAGERLLFRPGARFSYSNSGFIVLGLIVERVSGLSYYDYVQRHVFARAGMTRTACLRRGQGGETVAIGYTRANPGSPRTPNTGLLPPVGTSAGGCYSTVGDLHRFAQALLGHRLLSAALTETVTTAKVAAPDGSYGYGFAIRTGRPGDPPTIWHNGGFPGVGAEFDVNPKLGITVVVLANRDYPTVAPAIDLILNTLRVP